MPIERLTDDEIEELRAGIEIGDVAGEDGFLRPRLTSLLDEVRRARALLRSIEWNGMREGASCCPDCGAFPDTPVRGTHAKDCDLDALIWPRR